MAANPRAALMAANYAKQNQIPQQLANWYQTQTAPATQGGDGLLAPATTPATQQPATVEQTATTQAPQQTGGFLATQQETSGNNPIFYNPSSYQADKYGAAQWNVDNSQQAKSSNYQAQKIGDAAKWNVADNQLAKASNYEAATLSDPTKWNIDKNQTSAGQLENIIAKDGSLMQLARTRGMQQANQRGLLNTSMGIGAAQDSVIAAATPFAQQDATTYANAGQFNADAANKFAVENAGFLNQASQFNATANQDISKYNADVNAKAAGYNAETANKFLAADAQAANQANEFNATADQDVSKYNADMNAKSAQYNATSANEAGQFNSQAENTARDFEAQAANRANEFNATNQFTKDQALFEANVKASLSQIENEAGFDKQSQQMYAGLSDTLIKGMQQINQDVNMDQQSKDYAIKQLYDTYKSQVSLLSAVGSIPDVSTLLVEEKTDTETKQEADDKAATEAAAKRQLEANRVNAIARISKNKKANEQDVKDGFASYNDVGQPVFKPEFLKADADARKAANKKPTTADFRNGFAVKNSKGKLVWK